jgi:hypothetical protein
MGYRVHDGLDQLDDVVDGNDRLITTPALVVPSIRSEIVLHRPIASQRLPPHYWMLGKGRPGLAFSVHCVILL